MKKTLFILTTPLALLTLAGRGLSAEGDPMRTASPAECLPDPQDYSFLWWAYGPPSSCCPLRGPSSKASDENKIICIRTGRYAAAIDVEHVQLRHFGTLAAASPVTAALAEGNDVLFHLPRAEWSLGVRAGGKTYRCVRGGVVAQKDFLHYPYRLIESGRFTQRCDIQGLVFEDDQKSRLKATGRLEIAAWPDRLALIADMVAEEDFSDAELSIDANGGRARCEERGPWKRGEPRTARLTLRDEAGGEPPAVVEAARPDGTPLPVAFSTVYGWHRIELPNEPWSNAKGTYYPEEHLDRLDRVRLSVSNPSRKPQPVRLLFAADRGFPAITGFCPMLRDRDGQPTGIPVQLSKNWHVRREQRVLYDGAWFHGFSLLRLPPRSRVELEFAVAYARWGGVPAASHGQLCLIGWGHNQRWDEVAIGSFGESICYEPDGAQRRCMIDDIRPLMVWEMGGRPRKWAWTNNVGGGDFLVYFDEKGEYQYPTQMKAHYAAHGPNLTEVTYSGVTADGCIATRVTVSTPRCDDINRAYHRFRYDVLKPTRFRRLAFYQLGADEYLWHPFRKIARGNEKGLIEEWEPKLGGRQYHRTGIPCEGEVPWFSLHEAENPKNQPGPWANRGLVVRSWKARLGGRETPPFASVYGTQSGIASASLELSPPPGLLELRPGDFVEAEVELVVVPTCADDYYGPNEGLRAALKAGGNTWRPVFREAVGNHLEATAARGKVLRRYPVVVEVGRDQVAEIEVAGGVGYVPITFAGLSTYRGYELLEEVAGVRRRVDQSVHGSDFWQTDYDPASRSWRITYNVLLDRPGEQRQAARFIFGPNHP